VGLSSVTERGKPDPCTVDGVRGESEGSWLSRIGGEVSLLRIAVIILDAMEPLLPGLPELDLAELLLGLSELLPGRGM
jgi:hypothetical protein